MCAALLPQVLDGATVAARRWCYRRCAALLAGGAAAVLPKARGVATYGEQRCYLGRAAVLHMPTSTAVRRCCSRRTPMASVVLPAVVTGAANEGRR